MDNLITEHGQLTLRYGLARENCANLFEQLNHLEYVEGPELSSRYMMEIGQYEMREYQLWISVRRWRRRFELRQAAVNANKPPDLLAIERTLDEELAAFEDKLKVFADEKKMALETFHASRLTPQETTEVRLMYLNAAKRLHPDVNPNLGEEAAKLWNRIKNAYAERKWSEVRFLCSMIDTLAEKPKAFPATKKGVAALKKEIARLESVCQEQREKIDELNAQVPWSYRERLNDKVAVEAEISKLAEDIDALQVRIDEYERRWQEEVAA